jgi:tetratricopeptide (TPR) repeat protein
MCKSWRYLIVFALAAQIAAAALASPQETFDQIYGPRARASITAAQRIELAKQLVHDAADVPVDRPFQAFLYNKAFEFTSTAPEGFPTAVAAMQALESAQPVLKPACDEKILEVLDRQSRSGPISSRRAAGQEYINFLSNAAIAAERAGETDKAASLYDKALARSDILDAGRRAEIVEQLRQIRARQSAEKRVAALKAALNRSPEDSKSASELARLLLIDLDRPKEAVSYASSIKDPITRAVVGDAAKDVKTLPGPESLRLADWYRLQAGPKPPRAALEHAVAAYKQFLDQHPAEDADHLRATLAMQDLSHRLESLAPAHGLVVNLLPFINVQRDALEGTWKMTPTGIQCSGAALNRLRIPYQPPEEYDFRVEFTRTAGFDDIAMILSKSGVPFCWQFANANRPWRIGAGLDKPSVKGEPALIANNRPQTAVIQVRNDSITTYFEGHLIMKYPTNYKDVNPGAYVLDKPSLLGLGAWGCTLTFNVVEVVEITGTGKRVDSSP